MRIQRIKIGGLVASAVLLTTLATGCRGDEPATVAPVETAPAETTTPDAVPDRIVEPDQSSGSNSGSANPGGGDALSNTESNPSTRSDSRGDQQFVLVNDRSIPMFYFFASPTEVDDWENDILGDSVLMPGEQITININDGRETCQYDFQAIFEDESEASGFEINICELSSYTFE